MEETTATPKLDAPPIIEVMCGAFFPAVAGVDPILVGGWWHQIQSEYPRHSIQAAVMETPMAFSAGAPPVRSWLVSNDDEWVIQVQHDRFYVNWRKREGAYPRFSGPDGVGQRALRELRRFQDYCRLELKTEIVPAAVELAKVDLIIEGEHWKDQEDLGTVVPLIADVGRFAKSPGVELGLNLVEPRAAGMGLMQLTLSMSTEALRGGRLARTVKIETRCTRRLSERSDQAVSTAFAELNGEANDVFFGLINRDELPRFVHRKGST